MDYKAYALMAILLASVASVALVGTANAQALTVETGQPGYAAGDTIEVSGEVGTVQAGLPVLIRVFNPNGALARTDQITPIADGSYSYSFPAGGPLMGVSGEYRAAVTYRSNTEETAFNFITSQGGQIWRTVTVEIAGREHPIRYQISGGTLTNMTADPETATLTAMVNSTAINSTAPGVLVVELPRSMIQSLSEVGAPTGGNDTDFEAFVDTEGGIIDETMTNSTVRELTIPFDQGAEEIEIVGTWVVPEFGAIAAIILAIAIVGIIVATTRYSKFSSFMPRH
jgi:predicted secreted protein with PEFG-CTERM motif